MKKILMLAALSFCAVTLVRAQENKPPKADAKPKYEKSKYKAYRALTGKERTYRYDSKGRPVPVPKPGKKKKGQAAKVPVPVPSVKGTSAPAAQAVPAPEPEEAKPAPEAPAEQP